MNEKNHIDPHKAAELIEAYYQQGWTDGFPVIPPSEHSIRAMLAAAGLQENTVIATITTRNTVITADKVALNAVLAGCLPEYMPVIVSAVRGLSHPDFSYHGMATSTGGASLAIVVNGPIVKKLGINARDNVFGPGPRSNMTIGRALRLVMMNSLNTRPGILDRSTMGSPGKISFCFAENEDESPWEPLHVERGFDRNESTTTVYAAEDIIQIYNQLARTPEPLLLGMADAMANMGSVNIIGQQNVIVVFAGEHTEIIKDNGWSKKQVKQYLYDHAKRSVADLKGAARLSGSLQPGDEIAWRHVVRNPEDIIVICAGAAVGNFSACLLGWASYKSTRAITTLI
jgi:hypothetical protein